MKELITERPNLFELNAYITICPALRQFLYGDCAVYTNKIVCSLLHPQMEKLLFHMTGLL